MSPLEYFYTSPHDPDTLQVDKMGIGYSIPYSLRSIFLMLSVYNNLILTFATKRLIVYLYISL
jgi:hypothetical protein